MGGCAGVPRKVGVLSLEHHEKSIPLFDRILLLLFPPLLFPAPSFPKAN